jgi:hypothetical protein
VNLCIFATAFVLRCSKFNGAATNLRKFLNFYPIKTNKRKHWRLDNNHYPIMIFNFKEIVAREKEQLLLRRTKLKLEHGDEKHPNWFGIAMSGGGIRSATINMGFLKTLNRFGILQKADYLSTVSGGGYTHHYVQGTVKETEDFSKLFTDEQVDAMRQHGEYLIPGQGLQKSINTLLLFVSFGVSWLMSLISPMIIIGIVYYIYQIITAFTGNPFVGTTAFLGAWSWWAMVVSGGLLLLHAVINISLNFNLGVSKYFNRVEVVFAVVGICLYAWILVAGVETSREVPTRVLIDYGINAVLLFIIGFFTNPNALSFHRYYRKQLADLFLRFSGAHQNMPLTAVFNAESDKKKDYIAPYPLINTCLNLQNPGGDEKFKGSKASDYFLLSPLYCGSKLTGYVSTKQYWDYQRMTLPAAVTISAAAVNPGMGVYSNKILSILMTLFNARLGFWISNPLVLQKSFNIVWWPVYFFKELLGRIGLNNSMINISDGGHIENLGTYELLRRGCRLIIAVDAGEDPKYIFEDINNLNIRARNELGLEIRFRDDHQPEDVIRPRASQVYSKQRFALADVYQWWDDGKATDFSPPAPEELGVWPNLKEPRKVATLVYVKSSVKAPQGKPALNEEEDRLKYGTYKYKIYHPEFPHESTADQFFDEIQWEAYYQLGQYIGAEVLGLPDLEQFLDTQVPQPDVEKLMNWFDMGFNPFVAEAAEQVMAGADVEIFESVKAATEEPSPSETPEVKYTM